MTDKINCVYKERERERERESVKRVIKHIKKECKYSKSARERACVRVELRDRGREGERLFGRRIKSEREKMR